MTYQPARAVDASFRAFGRTVVLDPDALAVPVLAIVRAPDTDPEFQAIRTRLRSVTLEIRVASLAALPWLGDGSVIELPDGERRKVKGPLRHDDPDRLVALIDTVAE